MRRLDVGPGARLVVATHNPGKLVEIGALLKPFGMDAVSAGELDIPEPEETGSTFVENAVIKALASAVASGLPALADDSGLAVEALGGDPGIYSARWAGPDKDFDMAMETVNRLLGDNPDRRAAFVCALAVAWPDGHVETFEGTVDGTVCWPPRGGNGFGYDPFFVPEGFDETFGEMEPARKHEMSHRARAFALFVEACLKGA
ncbi:RdgB/HAM1 family non-canonical purine NTP pyrophosphatase [Phaeovibrio sulfidiphilus]|uniref:dITP/XTP pyrophosphatase n=1 Tax=Phaeovibrio sulfidiphilus TaxID=1220600 RepID=A0A8J7CNQ9_9PROT|nr:RdgB/HAM1 family non-canonical purine NTP pyrophosphatase [Phaeovibrio sulfidiphilus]MBE1236182.1 RdgB/HAM1 family non-canonical purine NTP pyrophosphatase [Phaeovibrio sulfidiphilus]